MRTKLIAFDPGGTTGVAIVELMDHEPGTDPFVPQFRNLQIGPHEHHGEIEKLLDEQLLGVDRRTVIYESFEYRKKSRAGLRLDSREYIGIIKNWCRQRGIPVVSQSAAQGKGFVSDNILKELNLYSKAYRHANDAMRHLLYFSINNEEFKFRGLPYELEYRKQLLDLGFK